jgi:hypothetical protein
MVLVSAMLDKAVNPCLHKRGKGAGLAITSLREPVPDEISEDHLKQWREFHCFFG